MNTGKNELSPAFNGIPILSNEKIYKYLGIIKNDKILHAKVKEIAKKDFFKRVRDILSTELNAKNTTDAIKTYAIPVLRYGFDILSWTIAKLSAVDRKVRKQLTKGKFHHPKYNTHRLYLSHKEGGRGLINATDKECTGLVFYLKKRQPTD